MSDTHLQIPVFSCFCTSVAQLFTLDLPQQPIEFNISLVQYHLTKQFMLLSPDLSCLVLTTIWYIPKKSFLHNLHGLTKRTWRVGRPDMQTLPRRPTLLPPSLRSDNGRNRNGDLNFGQQ